MAANLKKITGDSRPLMAQFDFAFSGNDTVYHTQIFVPRGAIIKSTAYFVSEDIDTSPSPGGFTFNIAQSGAIIFSNGDTSSPVTAGTAVKDDIFKESDGTELIMNYSGDTITKGKFFLFVEYYLPNI